MAKRHTSAQSMYDAQLARFQKMGPHWRAGMNVMKRDAIEELDSLVSGGGGATGKARIKALRAAGHPYGRKNTPQDNARARFGGKRGVGGKVGEFPQLPIGVISGGLRSGKFATVRNFDLTIGFDKRSGPGIAAVYPFGTNRMVGRGLWLPGEKGELGKRMKRARNAFKEAFFDPIKK